MGGRKDKQDCHDAREWYRDTLRDWREGNADRRDLNEAYREYLLECGLNGRGHRQQQVIVLPRHGGQVYVSPDGRFGFNNQWHDYNGLRGALSHDQWNEWLDIQRDRLDLERNAQGQGNDINGGSSVFINPETGKPWASEPLSSPVTPPSGDTWGAPPLPSR